MGKSTHFFGQPVYGQLIKSLDRDKIAEMSRKMGGEKYVKSFDGYVHLLTMIFAVIMRFDSLREIEAAMTAEVRKLHHLGIEKVPKRSTLSDANARRPEKFFEEVYRDLYERNKCKPYVDIKKGRQPKLVSLLTNDFDMTLETIVAIYRRRWQIESLFKQIKQNFPLRYFYGESSNAIKIQIWVTLIANLLISLPQSSLERNWSFSGLATMVRIVMMYYLNMQNFFNKPDADLKIMLEQASESPPEESINE